MRKAESKNGVKPCLKLWGKHCGDCINFSGELHRQGQTIIFVRCENRKMHSAPIKKE